MAGGAFIPGVKTSAFVGPAGTGKSQRAQLVASLVNADFIIDDGLVIHKGSIVCGKSAKSERNQISRDYAARSLSSTTTAAKSSHISVPSLRARSWS